MLIPIVAAFGLTPGCGSKTAEVASSKTNPATQTPDSQAPETQPSTYEPLAYEATAEQLLDARLAVDKSRDGWIRLFDGHTFFGWQIAGKANFEIEDQTITVDSGDVCLLCTTVPWDDYELHLQFRASPETNSGIFLRTPLEVSDPATECFEVNIAPASNPFPTGSVVKHAKGTVVEATSAEQWHDMHLTVAKQTVTVEIDGEVTCEVTSDVVPRTGLIGLQHNSGPVAFREILLRPSGMESLLDAGLSRWKQYPEMPGEFIATEDGGLRVQGGKQQLESRDLFGDFTLLANYRMNQAGSNSGLFFRSIPGDEMMGYECQVNDTIVDGNPLSPEDCGTGGVFRRQDARIVLGTPDRSANSILLNANGPRFASWVNGVQVSDIFDTRDTDANPRRGLRTEPGTLIVQGHDEKTDVSYSELAIKPNSNDTDAGGFATPAE
ncbi:MAG: DUF1080 domain-containing protein [Planctomycetota bacterium]